MELKIKFLRWSAGLPVAMINDATAKKFGIHPKDRVAIKHLNNSHSVSTIVDTIKGLVGEEEIAVSFELKEQLDVEEGQKVRISLCPPIKSSQYIKEKLMGKEFSEKELDEIIKDVVSNSLSEAEIGFFVATMYKQGMTPQETFYLTKAIYENGHKISFTEKFVVDKHCIGGIPGNRTSPIVVSICAAAGLTIPKSSSRAITSAAGTADAVETLAPVEFSSEDMKKIIKKTGGCLVWGGGLGMVTADSKIIQIEKILNLDPEAQMLASIMSKKLAMGSKYILIDIPYGKTAKVKDLQKAKELKKKFEFLGKKFGKKISIVLTDGTKPIGRGIGPVLEMKDVIAVLDPSKEGPKDLEEKSLFLAGEIFEMTGKAKKGQGKNLAKEILQSGKAFSKFKEIIEAQGGKVVNLKEGQFSKELFSKKSGKVEIDNKKISFLARMAGCPLDKKSGVYLHFNTGDKIKNGDKIVTIYSESKSRLEDAIEYYNSEKPIIVN